MTPEPVAERPVVVAVMWTYNRVDVARRCIEGMLRQTRPPDRIIVVDSASPDGSAALLDETFPHIEVVALPENEGMGAAAAEGLRRAAELPYDYVWFVEDDSELPPTTLATLVEFLEANREYSVVGEAGAVFRRGRWWWKDQDAEGPCDFCMLDGSLMRRAAVEAAGVPRADFFIMHIDVEYPLRVLRAGHHAYQLGHARHGALQLGAAASDSGWRSYYQTRNHLRMALDLRDLGLFWGFLVRTSAQTVTEVWRGKAGRRSVWLRFKGIVDALRHRMGRTLEPPAGLSNASPDGPDEGGRSPA